MTPKEKAKELVDKFYIGRSRDNLPLTMYWSSAIGCALIAVDEVIDILSILPYGMEYLSHIDYWEGVKQEIEKL